MYRLLILAAAASTVLGQVLKNGTCDVQPGQVETNVDIRGMLGTWYQVQRIPNTVEEGDCSTTTFGIIDYTMGTITNTEVVNGIERVWEGTVIRESVNDDSGRFIITFDGVSADYYVLATDYMSYALLYSCQNNPDDTKNVWAWLLSRQRNFNPSPAAEDALNAAVDRNPDVEDGPWRITKQNGC